VDQLVALLTLAASAATAFGVILAAWQLRLTKEQARIQFEDGLNAQYRECIRHLPVRAMLGEPLDDTQAKGSTDVLLSLLRSLQ